MSDTERLIQEIRRLPKDSVAQVLDFVGSLKRKTTAAAYVCPHCGKTEHVPNAATIAAFEEGDAMLRGEIPATWYHSPDDLDKALR